MLRDYSLKDLCESVKIMDFRDFKIAYITDITSGDVFLSIVDIFSIMESLYPNKIGRIEDDFDLIALMDNSKILSPWLKGYESDIIDYIQTKPVHIDKVIQMCKHYRITDLVEFLEKAKKQINELGIYIGDIPKFFNKSKNRDLNLCEVLDYNMVMELSNQDPYWQNDGVYYDICDSIYIVVFGDILDNLRYNKNLYSNDIVSNYITDEEYVELCWVCQVYKYLLKNRNNNCYIDESLLSEISAYAELVLDRMKKINKRYPNANNNTVNNNFKSIVNENKKKIETKEPENYFNDFM